MGGDWRRAAARRDSVLWIERAGGKPAAGAEAAVSHRGLRRGESKFSYRPPHSHLFAFRLAIIAGGHFGPCS